jgi:hypothetical protein
VPVALLGSAIIILAAEFAASMSILYGVSDAISEPALLS